MAAALPVRCPGAGISGLSPWDYLPAYVIHDWDFHSHHTRRESAHVCGGDPEAGGGIYTLISSGVAESNWLRIEIVYRVASSSIRRRIWHHAGSQAADCDCRRTRIAIGFANAEELI